MTRLVNAFEQFFDSAGDPLVSGKLFFYESGSSSAAKDTFADSGETIPNRNPVILGGDGRAPNIFGPGSYRVVLTDADEVQILSRDPVGGSSGVTFGADWSADAVYSISDVVRDAGAYWISETGNNVGNQPSLDGGTNWIDWPNYSNFGAATKTAIHRKNKLINAMFNVLQRPLSGVITLAAGEYGHDRFRGGSIGCTYTYAKYENYTIITITAGSLEQENEGDDFFSGNYVLSWAGSCQGRINGGSYGDSGEVTAAITGGTNVITEFGIGTLSLPQLEPGTQATEFEHVSNFDNLQRCQRYFQSLFFGGNTLVFACRDAIRFTGQAMALPVTLRAVPSPTTPAVSGSVSFGIAGAGAVTATANLAAFVNTDYVQFRSGAVNAGGSIVPFAGGCYHWFGDTTITLDAEL